MARMGLSVLLVVVALVIGCTEGVEPAATAAPATQPAAGVPVIPEEPRQLSRAQWQAMLDDMAFAVLRQDATEPRNASPLNREKRTGTFHCAGCGNALYSSETKFESGTGWPSFYQPVAPEAVQTKDDPSFGMVRTEVECARCDGHLGHVFEDAPDQPTGLRHCINGAAMVFVAQGQDIADVLAEYRARVAR